MASVIASVIGGTPMRVDATTVGDLKNKLELTNYTAAVNGETEDDDFTLSAEDFVSLSKAAKGGAR